MAKRAQQDSGEGRVTAKSRPMMNLTARTPSFVSSSASSNPGRTSYGYQDPEKYVLDDRTGQLVETSRSDYLHKDYGLSWSSQEWKSGDGERDRSGKPEENSWGSLQEVDPHREEYLLGRTAHSARYEETIHDRTGQPVSENLQDHFENFIMGSEITEFVNKVRDQVRIRQKRNTTQIHERTGDPLSQTSQKSQGKTNALNNIDCVPSNVQFSHQQALLYEFEDNAAVIKMFFKGRSPTMRHVSRTHRVALNWLFDRINLDPKIQIKYIDTKNQLADILTKGSFTRDEWNHLLCLFKISHFNSTDCLEVMWKRTKKDSGEERVTAKSKQMMNLVSRCSERTPDALPSTASESPVKTRMEC